MSYTTPHFAAFNCFVFRVHQQGPQGSRYWQFCGTLDLKILSNCSDSLLNVGLTYGMLSSAGFSGVDILFIYIWLLGVQNPRFVAIHLWDLFCVPPLWSYPPPLISNFLLFERGSWPQNVCVLMGCLTPSSNTGQCVSLSDRPSPLLTHHPLDMPRTQAGHASACVTWCKSCDTTMTFRPLKKAMRDNQNIRKKQTNFLER